MSVRRASTPGPWERRSGLWPAGTLGAVAAHREQLAIMLAYCDARRGDAVLVDGCWSRSALSGLAGDLGVRASIIATGLRPARQRPSGDGVRAVSGPEQGGPYRHILQVDRLRSVRSLSEHLRRIAGTLEPGGSIVVADLAAGLEGGPAGQQRLQEFRRSWHVRQLPTAEVLRDAAVLAGLVWERQRDVTSLLLPHARRLHQVGRLLQPVSQVAAAGGWVQRLRASEHLAGLLQAGLCRYTLTLLRRP